MSCANPPLRFLLGMLLAGSALVAPAALILTLASATAIAQTAYKYRDADGHWVFTDRGAPAAAAGTVAGDSFALGKESDTLHLSVDRTDTPAATQLIAVNDCLCVVTFDLSIKESGTTDIPNDSDYTAVLEPGTRQTLLQIPRKSGKPTLRYVWRAALGSPDAVHSPSHPYRAPFAIGSTYPISQAYPARFTHVTPDSEYAIDIALPDGTPVYSAREGTVINVRHDSFRGAAAPAMMDQANVVEILHNDGTIAIYAHLHWDSIRVRIGERVARGQYIADSGNTGFSSGPHLHFAVIRNGGVENISVPVQFTGAAGIAVTAVTRMALTAY